MEKKTVRNIAKEIRTKLDIETISAQLVNKIQELDIFKQARSILLFYPKAGELNLTELASDKTKTYYLPRLQEDCIECCCWQQGDELKLSKYKILEPCTNATPIDQIDLIILPGLCADLQKNRLGYGKGCYDKLLQVSGAISVFPIPDELLFKQIPSEAHDQKPDIVITPTKILQ